MSAPTGLERISQAFDAARAQRRAAFMPYHAMGYPSRDATLTSHHDAGK